jgi:formiminotetrahydrofolate cyclodeaminase
MTPDLSGLRIADYLQALGSSEPTPGGGSAAALAGALASALGHMVVSVAKEKESTPERQSLVAAFGDLEAHFLRLAAEDERAFAQVVEALRIPKDVALRQEHLQTALERAAAVPLRAASASVSTLEHLLLAEPHASRSIVSDIGVAAYLALAALRSSLLNADANLRSMKDVEARDRFEREANALTAAAETAHDELVHRVAQRLSSGRS